MFPAVIYSGVTWGAQNAWLSFYMTTMEEDWAKEPYSYSNNAIGLMNIACIIGAVVGCLYAGFVSDYFVYYMATRRNGIKEPERRLYLMFPTAIISPLGMFIFGIGTHHQWHWVPSYIGLGMIGFGWGCAGDLSLSYLMDCYPKMVLEGMVGVSIINNSMACMFTFFCEKWIESQGTFNTYIAIGSLNLLFFCSSIPMIIWGKACRKKTKKLYVNFLYLRDRH